jgi:hypothetical protein
MSSVHRMASQYDFAKLQWSYVDNMKQCCQYINITGRITLKQNLCYTGTLGEGVDCIQMAQNNFQLWVFVNTVINLRVP